MLVFEERGKPEYPEEKPLAARERTNNKLNPHMASDLGTEPGPHWWERSALTTTPPLLYIFILTDLEIQFAFSKFSTTYILKLI